MGVGHFGQQRFALVIPAEAYAGTGAQSGHWERHQLLTTEDVGVSVLATDPSDPSVLYAITDSEVLKTSDGAASWKQISTMRAWAIAVDPASPPRSHLAASEALLRSDDGGATWTDLSGPGLPWMNRGTRVRRVWLDPNDPFHAPHDGTVGPEAREYRSRFPLLGSVDRPRWKTWTELTKEEADQADQAKQPRPVRPGATRL